MGDPVAAVVLQFMLMGEWVTQALCLPIVPVTEGAGRCWKGWSQEALALGELGAMSP